LCVLFDAWREDGPGVMSVRLFDALLERELTGSSGLCVLDGECSGYLVVEHNGDIYPCDFFVAEPWKLGNLCDPGFAPPEERAGWSRFRAMRAANAAACAGCEWWSLCRGGCPKDRMLAGGPDRRSFLCEGYRKFFTHALPKLPALAAGLRSRP
jgi:uncharacterized protein